MSRDFKYPALRVRLPSVGTRSGDNGECQPRIADISFSILCYAGGSSSKACAVLASSVFDEIGGDQLISADIVPLSRIWLPPGGIIMPVPEGERLWRSEVQLRTMIKQAGLI